ncbi:TetR family transcriptional regulator [Nocardia yunnanensis]|uniref:TetR family transcriptional regulator n=1 Tax=Nocardia yunnanensis TaxID=2382165 RepID=A0A386ZDQ8_9NOCA|nr:TetR family transcriptional regulator [Nocardia yunnanensis]AYF75690.1 TetR family transcriptional regulator [Nocardia yunnanensis]
MTAIAEGGLEAMSVRSVARRLGVDAKSLYHHVEGKEGLLDAVTDHILSTIDLPEPTGDLEHDLRAFAHAFRRHAIQHPHATSLVPTRQTKSPASLVPIEAALSILITAGAEPVRAVHILRAFMAAMVGVVLRDADSALTFGATADHDITQERPYSRNPASRSWRTPHRPWPRSTTTPSSNSPWTCWSAPSRATWQTAHPRTKSMRLHRRGTAG